MSARPCAECLRGLPPGEHWPACSQYVPPSLPPLVLHGAITAVRVDDVDDGIMRDGRGVYRGRTCGTVLADLDVYTSRGDDQRITLPLTAELWREVSRLIARTSRPARVRVTVEVLP